MEVPRVPSNRIFFLVDRMKKKKNYYLSSITTCLLLPHCLISMEDVNKHADLLILAKRLKSTFINKKDEKCTPNNHGDCMLPEIPTKITMK